MLIKACLNGAREPGVHPDLPITPAQLAAQARACVAAGAGAIHMHPRDQHGLQSLDPEHIAAALRAVRAACPGTPIGLSTLYSILPDPVRRAEMVAAWTVRPDFVSVNFGEPGTPKLCEILQKQGIGIEAGLYSVESTQEYVASGMMGKCMRILLEPDGGSLNTILADVTAMESVLDQARDPTPRLLHSDGPGTWAMLDVAQARGYDTRIGLEDVLTMPDGSIAPDNAAMVSAAMAALHSRTLLLIRHAAPQIMREEPAHTWPLSEAGRASCTSLSDVLNAFRPAALFCSHEPKARETAEIIASHLGLSATVWANLHEHNRRGVEWMGDRAFQEAITLFFRQPRETVFGLESAEQAGQRFEQALDGIVAAVPDRTIAIATHGTVMTLLTARHNQIDSYSFWKQLSMPAIVALCLPDYRLKWTELIA